MQNTISLSQAKQLVLAPEGIVKVHIPLGDTDDIIKTIQIADRESAKFTRELAPLFKSSSKLTMCRSVFDFVLKNIHYQVWMSKGNN